MAIEDTINAWAERLRGAGFSVDASDGLNAMRDALRRGVNAIEGPATPMQAVRDLDAPGGAGPVKVRHYTPLAAGVPPGPHLLFFHGGGFVMGDLESHDRLCRRLAASARMRVLSVNYRLAPAHPFPAAVEDALAVYDWLNAGQEERLGAKAGAVAVGGDSAGGNLAAVVAQARRGDAAPAFQVLLYPWLQMVDATAERFKVAEGTVLSAGVLSSARKTYLGEAGDPHDVRVSPLLQNDLAGLPPAYVVTCGLDPLHGEGRAYADKLAAAGVSVTHAHFANAPHGYFQFTAFSREAREGIDAAGKALAAAFG